MKILFLDQSGKLGGAEISLLDIAQFYRNSCLVSLFDDGSFKEALEKNQIPVRVLSTTSIQVRKDSSLFQSLSSVVQLIPLINQVVRLSKNYDLIYANTQKALVVGAISSRFANRPLVYHLRDILSLEHFSQTNRRLAVSLANNFASLVIANSQATKTAFIEAGGKEHLAKVVYNGFKLEKYQSSVDCTTAIKQQYNLDGKFVVGHFSRLSPWKGQHILLEALTHSPAEVVAIFVGDALFGEEEYVQKLHQQVASLGLENRVRFLGFRSDIPQLMSACDLVAHTSTAPEPFGRVIIEAMLCQKPAVAAAAGGTVELIKHEQTGWLTTPGDVSKLAAVINQCCDRPEQAAQIALAGKTQASENFELSAIQHQIDELLNQILLT
ncbi:MAG: glycosyltransferase family 4 protein [Pleurocapsa sp.]